MNVVDIEAPARVYPRYRARNDGLICSRLGWPANPFASSCWRPRIRPPTTRGSKMFFGRTPRHPGDGRRGSFDRVSNRTQRCRQSSLSHPSWAPPGDLDAADNQQTCFVQIVDRKTKLLIVAGGPTREYQFCAHDVFSRQRNHFRRISATCYG